MPRDLDQTDVSTLKIRDNLSGSDIELFYRMPTADEVARYRNSLAVRVRNRLVVRVGETRQKFGALILMGFRTGDFTRKKVPLASDPASPHYAPDWKEIVKAAAPDIIETLAIHVFEGSSEEIEDDDEDATDNGPLTTDTLDQD